MSEGQVQAQQADSSPTDDMAQSEQHTNIDLVSKVSDIFKELTGGRAANVHPALFPYEVRDTIKQALSDEFDGETADRIAFHLVDWNGDAAFLVALLLFPERFTSDEISEGITDFLMHAPDHVAEAARRGGFPIRSIFADDVTERESAE